MRYRRALSFALALALCACAGAQQRDEPPAAAKPAPAKAVAPARVEPFDLTKTSPAGPVLAAGPVEGKGGIFVKTVPAGAQVLLDGVPVKGRTPLALEDVLGGQHFVYAFTEDRGAGQSVEVRPDAFVTANLELGPLGGRALILSDPPEAQVFVDGAPAGRTPLIVGGLTPGDHTFRLGGEGLSEESFVATYRGTEIQRFEKQLRPAGGLVVGSNMSGVVVKLNGVPVGELPLDLQGVPAGTYVATFDDARFAGQKFTVKVELGQTATHQWNLVEQLCHLVVETTPAEAKVFVDDAEQGKGPKVDLEVPCGLRKVRAENWRFLTGTAQIDLKSGVTGTVKLNLKTAPGSLKLTSTPTGATVVVNSQAAVGTTPVSLPEVPAGTYEIEFRLANHNTVSRTVIVKPKKESEVSVMLKPR